MSRWTNRHVALCVEELREDGDAAAAAQSWEALLQAAAQALRDAQLLAQIAAEEARAKGASWAEIGQRFRIDAAEAAMRWDWPSTPRDAAADSGPR